MSTPPKKTIRLKCFYNNQIRVRRNGRTSISSNTNTSAVRAGEWVREVQEFLNTRRDGGIDKIFIRGRRTKSAAAGSKSDLGKCSPERLMDRKHPSGADEDLVSLEDEIADEEPDWMRVRVEDEKMATSGLVLKGHKGNVTCMARCGWLSDILASGSTDGTSRLWNPVSGESLCVLRHGVDVTALSVCRRTQSLITGTQDGTVWSWDVESGERTIKVDQSHNGAVTCVCVDTGGVRTSSEAQKNTPDLSRVVTAGAKSIHIWDMRSRRPLVRTLRGHTDQVTSLAIHSPSWTLLSGSRDQSVRAWDIRMGRMKFTSREHFGSICCLGVTHERAAEFISGAKDSSIKVWNSSGKCLRTMRNHRGAVHSISFLEEEGSERSSRIISGSADANVRLWNIHEGRCMKILRGHKAPVTVVCWPTESKAVSGSRDGKLKIWNLQESRCVKTLDGHTGSITGLVCGSKSAVSSSKDGTLRVWDIS